MAPVRRRRKTVTFDAPDPARPAGAAACVSDGACFEKENAAADNMQSAATWYA